VARTGLTIFIRQSPDCWETKKGYKARLRIEVGSPVRDRRESSKAVGDCH
jgi:hypothetical protein